MAYCTKLAESIPGQWKEILLCVATEDGAFKDIPLVFEASAIPEISHEEPSKGQDAMEVDKKDEKEDDEEEDPLASPVRQTMPPKMRRAWQKKVEEPKPAPGEQIGIDNSLSAFLTLHRPYADPSFGRDPGRARGRLYSS